MYCALGCDAGGGRLKVDVMGVKTCHTTTGTHQSADLISVSNVLKKEKKIMNRNKNETKKLNF